MTGDQIVMNASEDAKVKLKAMGRQYKSSRTYIRQNPDGSTTEYDDFDNFIMDELRLGDYGQYENDFLVFALHTITHRQNKIRLENREMLEAQEKWNSMFLRKEIESINEKGEKILKEELEYSPEQIDIMQKHPKFLKSLEDMGEEDEAIQFLKDVVYMVVNVSVSAHFGGKTPMVQKILVPHSIHEVREQPIPAQSPQPGGQTDWMK